MIPPKWSPPGHEVYLMANNKSKTKTKQVVSGNQKAKTKSKNPKQKKGSMPARQMAYAQLLKQPDSGQLPDGGVYDGELGNFRRFVATIDVNQPTHTAGYVAFVPATGNGLFGSVTAASGTPAVALGNTSFPGAAYLQANAYKTRGIACKIELIPSAASITNITGECASGVSTLGSFPGGVVTVNHMFDIAKAYGPLKRDVVQSNWFPSGLDHTYSQYNVAPNEDSNVVFVAYRGWPAGIALSVRITYVVEFTVKNTIGIPPTGQVSNPVGHHQVIQALQTADPHWHHSIMDEFKSIGKSAVHSLSKSAWSTFSSGLVKQIPKFASFL